MDQFFNSWIFNVVKATLAAAAAAILAAAASGEATLPVWLAPILMGVSGALQSGQKR